eukprot:TRINITY_DN8176_c0_g1_i1.p1 TRINITY_DN8176_c0_g1~~TRINITY_DN8176_c0_g1_i1.p1  ORF type:complete len:139 (+),score=25.08 TRINITY_DN8176_c0_g1_i1:221-637(+)
MVLNIFIFTIEDAYNAAKIEVIKSSKPRSSWVIRDENLNSEALRDFDIHTLFDIIEMEFIDDSDEVATFLESSRPSSPEPAHHFSPKMTIDTLALSERHSTLIIEAQERYFKSVEQKIMASHAQFLENLKKQLLQTKK